MISTPDLYARYRECAGVSTDTRQIQPGTLFFALKGPRFNANTLAAEALEKGARYAVVDEADCATDERYLLVDDGLRALQDLARYHRRTLSIPVVALTGSNGKTTTKELLHAVLSRRYRAAATRGNLNNHIGVPLTLLALDDSVELAIIEMGANRQGDIRELVAIAEPTHGLITNIGKAHLEGFGGLAGVRRGKGELFDFLTETGGVIVYNGLDGTLGEMVAERNPAYAFRYADNAILFQETPFVRYRVGTETIDTHLTGGYNFANIRAALALGRYFGVPDAEAHAAVAAYVPENNRSQVVQRGTNTVLLDAYNANPSSMGAAIRNFDHLTAERKMVILGDMFELGDNGPAEHAALGQLLADCRFDLVLLAGPLMQHALGALPRAYYFPDKFGLHIWLQDHPQQHTHVLVKGSRGMGLESVVPFL
jgi:UDP-N-acetylmuramoyl-tripeptide--D-alanyl-D-alanine ligase